MKHGYVDHSTGAHNCFHSMEIADVQFIASQRLEMNLSHHCVPLRDGRAGVRNMCVSFAKPMRRKM